MIRTQSLQTNPKLIAASLRVLLRRAADTLSRFPSYFGNFADFFCSPLPSWPRNEFSVSRSFSSTFQRLQLALRVV